MTVEFQAFPKMQRLYDSSKGVSITEKIDGSNAAVIVRDGELVGVQSRKRLITPEDDNFGFARWAYSNAEGLARVLGDGTHYGEWFGKGIQRGYGLDEKRFALFNAVRWLEPVRDWVDGSWIEHKVPDEFNEVPGLTVVPELFRGSIEPSNPLHPSDDGLDEAVEYALTLLKAQGSWASPGFDRPEGVVVFFIDSRTGYKVIPKGWEPGSKKATRG